MTEEIKGCDMDIVFFDKMPNIKEELEDEYYADGKGYEYETIAIKNDTEAKHGVQNELNLFPSAVYNTINENVEGIGEISPDNDIKKEYKREHLFCNYCENYQDYCTKCGMLTHILNMYIPTTTCERVVSELPNNILEIRESCGHLGIYVLKVIPEGVRFGPFTGLTPMDSCYRIKGGRFAAAREKSQYLNWMQYINPAKNISEQNLFVLQNEDDIYYGTNREIQEGEELLLYFGEDYEDSLHKDIEANFVPIIQGDSKDVFACTLCCLGFSSRVYLAKHKNICVNESNEAFLIEEITQCPICKIYMYKKEYLDFHMAYCSGKNTRKRTTSTSNSRMIEAERRKTQQRHMHKCTQCKYKTAYKSDLQTHVVAKHCKVKKTHNCNTCRRRFKTKASLKMHVTKVHVQLEGKTGQKCFINDHGQAYIEATDEAKQLQCSSCKYRTPNKYYLKRHVETSHIKTFEYKCDVCPYKTHCKRYLRRHVRARHLHEYNYKCDSCEYKSNNSGHLRTHIKSVHLKEFHYKCDRCAYETNKKSNLDRHTRTKHAEKFDYACADCTYQTDDQSHFDDHIKTKHSKEFNYNCESCAYKTNIKSHLAAHARAKHLKEFDYKCESCAYSTNKKLLLQCHTKTKHLKEFNYKCETCRYETNQKSKLKSHVKTKHLKEFEYKCDGCEYATNNSGHLRNHVETRHLKEFGYVCEACGYKTNRRSNLDRHARAKHLLKFRYECVDCEYRTNERQYFDAHVKTKHLKEFNFVCETCDYKTNKRSHLVTHTRAKHLKEFNYVCEVCGYRTNQRSHLEVHAKSKHLKEFSLHCASCEYRTNYKASLEAHVKRKHPNCA